jgi:hypothetical protein
LTLPFKPLRKIEDAWASFLRRSRKSPKRWRKAGQFDLAFQAAQKIEDASRRSEVLEEITEAMAKAGQFDLALQAAQKIEDAWDRSQVLAVIAAEMAEAGQFDLALQVAQKIKDASASFFGAC